MTPPTEPRVSPWMFLGFEPTPWRTIARSPLTLLLAVAIVLAFVAVELAGGSEDLDVLVRLGATERTAVWDGERWRLVTAAFLHAGWLHVVGNVVVLLGWAARVERDLGALALAYVWLVASVVASSASLLGQHLVGVGASGPILGLIGVVLVMEYRLAGGLGPFLRRPGVGRRLFALSLLLGLGLLSALVLPLQEILVDNYAHAAGLAAGIVTGIVLTRRGIHRSTLRGSPILAAVLILGAVVLGIVATSPLATAHGRWQMRFDQAWATEDHGEVLRLLDDVPRDVDPASVEYWRAQTLVALDEHVAAVAAIDRLERRTELVGGSLSADAHALRAEALLDLGEPYHALADLDAALALAPGLGHVRFNRGLAHQRLGEHAAAVDDYSILVEAQPGDVEARVNLARSLWMIDRHADAHAELDAAEALRPRCADCAALRGWIFESEGRLPEAASRLAAAVEIDPDLGDAYNGLCIVRDSLPDASAEETLATCEHAARLTPDNPAVHFARGRALTRLDRFRAAVEAFGEGFRYDRHDPYAKLDRGWAYHRLGDDEAALVDVESAAVDLPDDPAVWLTRAEVLAGLGEYDRARADARQALAVASPDWTQRERAEALVARRGRP